MLINKLGDGGAERLAIELAVRLPTLGYDVTFCTTRLSLDRQDFQSAQRERLAASGVAYMCLGRRNRADSLRMLGLFRYLRRSGVDVLHSHMFGSNVWGTLAGRLCGVPVVVAHEHGWSFDGQLLRKWVDGRVIGRLASAVAVGSNVNRTHMLVREGMPPDKAILIPNAFFPRARVDGDLREQLGVPRTAFVVGAVSKLREEKALDVLLEAFRGVRASMPAAQLILAGDGPVRGDLERMAKRLGIADSTTFLGSREDIEAVLRTLDVAVVCSDFEATSLSALEAMAYGTPLICTDVGGLRDLVTDREDALVVPPRNARRLQEALELMARDDALRARLARRARERVGDFSVDAWVRQYDELYRRVLSERP